jgi:hypothetical protein
MRSNNFELFPEQWRRVSITELLKDCYVLRLSVLREDGVAAINANGRDEFVLDLMYPQGHVTGQRGAVERMVDGAMTKIEKIPRFLYFYHLILTVLMGLKCHPGTSNFALPMMLNAYNSRKAFPVEDPKLANGVSWVFPTPNLLKDV